MSDMEFTEQQIERYSRHILLDEVGGSGQMKLMESSAFVVGAGGLGSPALLYLAGAGVGRLGIADSDRVELSNLHRQIIHGTGDINKSKVFSAGETIHDINPDCEVHLFNERLSAGNIRQLLRGYDVVLDGSDNFPTRFLVADCCRFENIPLVSAAVIRMEGQLMTILPGEGNPCYRCFLPQSLTQGQVPTCSDAGILGAAAGVMGTLQAVEAIKVLLGIGNIMSDRLLIYDALECSFTIIQRVPIPDCPLCGSKPTITDLMEYKDPCVNDSGESRSSL